MNQQHESWGTGVFELSVDGELGPLLRCAVRPQKVVRTGSCTVVRTMTGNTDLVELVRRLTCAGLLIESIRVVGTTPD